MKRISKRLIQALRTRLFTMNTQKAASELRAAGLTVSFNGWHHRNVVDVIDEDGHVWLGTTFDPAASSHTDWLARELRRALKLYQNRLTQPA